MPTYEPGADGKPQAVIPDAEKVPQREILQRAAETPLRPKTIQRPLDCGLFGSDALQLDLVNMLTTTTHP